MRHYAIKLIEILQSQGHQALLAGGCVRDSLMGIEPKDYDIATSATPREITQALEGVKTIPLGESFGVIVARIDGINYEIATFRNDGIYTDSRRPDTVSFISDPREDAARRDFTINSLFETSEGKVLDYFGGIQDIQVKALRAVGNPQERLTEDPLRMLRAVRFAVRYGFYIEPITAKAIENNAALISNISQERICKELELMLMGANPSCAMRLLKDTGLLDHILPELLDLSSEKGEQDPTHHPEGNTWIHTLMVLDILSESKHKTPGLMFAGLLHDIGKPLTQERQGTKITNHNHDAAGEPIAKQICQRLKMKGSDIDFISYAVKIHMRLHKLDELRKSKARTILENPRILELIDLQDGDARGRGCISCGNKSRKQDNLDMLQYFQQDAPLKLNETPLVNGKLLIKMGFKPSPRFKTLINAGIEAQLNNEIKDPEQWVNKYMEINAVCWL